MVHEDDRIARGHVGDKRNPVGRGGTGDNAFVVEFDVLGGQARFPAGCWV
jgi:hypothetical protein